MATFTSRVSVLSVDRDLIEQWYADMGKVGRHQFQLSLQFLMVKNLETLPEV